MTRRTRAARDARTQRYVRPASMSLKQRSGGSFSADPNRWVMDDEIPVTNPSVFAMGKPGTGTSSCSFGPLVSRSER